jgi:hypothetical protein
MQISRRALACPKCGRPTPIESPPSVPSTRRGSSFLFFSLVATFFVFCVLLIATIASDPKTGKVNAYIECKHAISSRLKAPNSAKWPSESADWVTEDLGGRKYRVRSYLDAQNTFGAMLRQTYSCTVEYDDQGRYRINDLSIDPG